MLLALITVWYFLVSDLSADSEPKRSKVNYPDQATCERMAEFTHRTNFTVVVQILSARPVYDDKGKFLGQYQRTCQSEQVDPGRVVIVPR